MGYKIIYKNDKEYDIRAPTFVPATSARGLISSKIYSYTVGLHDRMWFGFGK